MKKVSTWYLFALAILNLLLAHGTSVATDMWINAYHVMGFKLPWWTVFALHYYWWPYLFVGFTFLLALISVGTRWSSAVFFHFIVIILVIECFILFMSQIAFVMPYRSLMT